MTDAQTSVEDLIQALSRKKHDERSSAAKSLFASGARRIEQFLGLILRDPELQSLMVSCDPASGASPSDQAKLTVGVAVSPAMFEKIREANGTPRLAEVPSDQDALEFELQFEGGIALDILTTKAPGKGGAIDHFLRKFGHGIQQVELDVTDVDRATDILQARFNIRSIYPKTHSGSNGTRVNFFVVTENGKKALIELVEQPGPSR